MQIVEDRRYEGRHRAPVGEETAKLLVKYPVSPGDVEFRSKSLADDHAPTRVIRFPRALLSQVRALWGAQ
ncbi:hypothetical protein AB0F72_09455 [Actinoplanes sp. NPDC023936]|uniref:hypothetical protein n=1 Tax=Actinoplanes sp. NPDC023936 TaxID=3154910 RepID=UPI0033E234CB